MVELKVDWRAGQLVDTKVALMVELMVDMMAD